MDITKILCKNKDWIHKAQGRALVKKNYMNRRAS
jgi:hypothetical protein